MFYFVYNDLSVKVINTALELRDKFKEIKQRHEHTLYSNFNLKSNVDINLKCGIHIGKVLFGYWHTPLRAQITAIGNEVNFCSRLESFADLDQIIVSEQMKNIIKHDFLTKEIEIPENKKLKSYEDVRYVYEIIGRK
ncbi:MAG: adenylate/guanylate cyclase domain-containing protein [Nitrososphaeraceae archaeon]